MMAASLLRAGSGMVTGYRIVRLGLKGLMRLPVHTGHWSILLLPYFLARGAASVFLSWGRKSVDLLQEGSRIADGISVLRVTILGVNFAGWVREHPASWRSRPSGTQPPVVART